MNTYKIQYNTNLQHGSATSPMSATIQAESFEGAINKLTRDTLEIIEIKCIKVPATIGNPSNE